MRETDGALLDAVRSQVGEPDAEISVWERRALSGGLVDAVAGGDGLLLHSGTVRTSHGEREFELVEKICRVLPIGREPGSWLYWKREALAYESGLLGDMPPGLAAPRCFGVAYTDTPSARIFMEAISDPQPGWTADTHARAGEALGLFNGNHLGMPDIGRHPWMSAGRAHTWTAVAAETLDDLANLRSDPVVSRWIRQADFDRTIALWRDIRILRNALADLTMCFCHHDAFKRNILFRQSEGGGQDPVAIDWAFTGPGVLGEDIAATLGASLMLLEIDPAEAPALTAAIYDGYLSGLRTSGWSGAVSDIRLGFCATTAMTFGLGAMGAWLPLLRDPALEPVLEGIVRAPKERFFENLSVIHSYFLDLGEEALQLARS